jgi:hypothetical protein
MPHLLVDPITAHRALPGNSVHVAANQYASCLSFQGVLLSQALSQPENSQCETRQTRWVLGSGHLHSGLVCKILSQNYHTVLPLPSFQHILPSFQHIAPCPPPIAGCGTSIPHGGACATMEIVLGLDKHRPKATQQPDQAERDNLRCPL